MTAAAEQLHLAVRALRTAKHHLAETRHSPHVSDEHHDALTKEIRNLYLLESRLEQLARTAGQRPVEQLEAPV